MPFVKSFPGGLSPVRGPEASRTPAVSVATRRLTAPMHRTPTLMWGSARAAGTGHTAK